MDFILTSAFGGYLDVQGVGLEEYGSAVHCNSYIQETRIFTLRKTYLTIILIKTTSKKYSYIV